MNQEISNTMLKLTRLLTGKQVNWCICAGAAGAFYGVKRKITDLDVLVHPKDKEKLIELFNMQGIPAKLEEKEFLGKTEKDLKSLKALVVKTEINSHEVEFIFDVAINNKWGFTGDRELYRKVKLFEVDGKKVPVASPEDIIVLKAMLQRGKAMNKRDIEDITQIMRTVKIDLDYLRRRASKGHAGARVMPLIGKLIREPGIGRRQNPKKVARINLRRIRRF